MAIEKVYNLKTIGGQETYNVFDKLNAKLIEIKKNKIDLNNAATSSKEPKVISEIVAKLNDLIAQEKKLVAEIAKVSNQIKAQQLLMERKAAQGKKDAADELTNAKVATEASKQKTEAKRQETQETIRGYNEERKAAAETQKQLKQLQLARAQARAGTGPHLAGSYNDIAAQYKTMLAATKSGIPLTNTADIERATAALMKLKNQLDAFNRSLTQDKLLIGEYTSGIVQAFQKMGLGSLITQQVTTAKASLATLNTEFERLKAELIQIRATGQGSLQAVEALLIQNRQAAMSLDTQLNQVQNDLRSMGGMGTQITNGIAREFANLKSQVMAFVIGYLGFQQLISGMHKAIRENYALSDSFVDIQNRMHTTAAGVDTLVDSLKELDTRSSVASLVDIGALISKKGVAAQEIAGVTQAVDNLMVALGKEIGDPHEAVSSLIKLVNVYSEDKHVTAANIDQIGGAIARLTTTGVATGRFLIDFAERMAGVRGITGITIDKVLGLGAALEELGQRTEVSATALSQMIVKLFTDSNRYANLLGVTGEKYSAMLRDDVMGTFVLVAETLKGNAQEMEHFFEGVIDAKMRGARVVGVLGDIAANAEYTRKRMAVATEAMHEQGIVADMAAAKQHNFAASVDRVKKSFELFYTSKGFAAGLEAAAKAMLVLTTAMPTLIRLGAVMLVGWISLNAQLLITKTRLMVASAWNLAYAGTMGVLTGAINVTTGALRAMAIAAVLNPVGAFIALIAAATAATVALWYALSNNRDALTVHARALLYNNEVHAKAQQETAATAAKVKMLTEVIKDNTVKEELRKKALEDLIAINPDYLKGLDAENIKTAEGTKIISAYLDAMKKKAAFQAADAIQGDLLKKDAELAGKEYQLEQDIKGGKSEGVFSRPLVLELEDIKEQRRQLEKELAAIKQVVRDRYEALGIEPQSGGGSAESAHGGGGTKGRTVKDIKEDLEAARKGLDYKVVGSDELKQQLALVARLEKELENALNKKKKGRSSEPHDYINAELKTESRLAEYRAKLLEEQIKLELNANKEIADNEHYSLAERMHAYGVYSDKVRELHDMEAKRELAAVQLKLAKIAEIEAAQRKNPKERSKEEKGYFDRKGKLRPGEQTLLLQKDELLAQVDLIKATTETKAQEMNTALAKGVGAVLKSGVEQELKEIEHQLDKQVLAVQGKADAIRERLRAKKGISEEKRKRGIEDLEQQSAVAKDQAEIDANDKKIQQLDRDYNHELEQLTDQHIMELGLTAEQELRLTELKKQGLDLRRKLDDDNWAIKQTRQAREHEVITAASNQAIDLAQQASNAYMQLLQRQNDLQERNAQKGLEWNKKKADSQVQSQAQQMANERAYAAAQEQLEREKLKRNRQIAKSQMTIDYAVAVMKILAANAWNLNTLGAIQVAGLTGAYMAKMAMMDRFEAGGEVPGSGGQFGGRSHKDGGTAFHFKGRAFEAEAGELAIINKRTAASNRTMTVTGTPKQIASGINAWGGGVNFAPGAKMRTYEYGGTLGAQVQPPAIVAEWYARERMGIGTGGNTNAQIQALATLVANQNAAMLQAVAMESSKPVVLNPHAVSGYQDGYKKNVKVGTL